MMNKNMKKIMAICLAVTMAAPAFACSSKPQQPVEVETISLEDTKKELTFSFNNGASADATEANEENAETTAADAETAEGDATTQEGDAATEAGEKETVMEDVTQYMNVTDADGQNVTDADGQSVTEPVVVGTRPVEVSNQTPAATTKADEPAKADATEAPASYTPQYDTCKAYWLDMTQMGDFKFNGEFLTFTFEVKDSAPDGNYPITITYTDIASWDLVQYDPVRIDGEIAVNKDPAKQADLPTEDFALKINSEKAKQGDTVVVKMDLANNPGFCGFVIDVQYDMNALKLIEGDAGSDFGGAVSLN